MKLFKSKKGFVSVLSEIKIYLVFVLVVLIFLMLYMISQHQINNRVKDDFQDKEASLVINNLVYTVVVYDGKEQMMAELFNQYQSFGESINWRYDPPLGEFIKKSLTDYIKKVYGNDAKYLLVVGFTDEQGLVHSLKSGSKGEEDKKVTQVIPGSNKNNIIITFWPPK